MKKFKLRDILFFLTLLALIIIGCQSEADQTDTKNETDTVSEKTLTFDEELARQLNADEYGMKQYVMAFLKRGPNTEMDSATSAQLQRAHLDNINKLAKEGRLILAGPFLDDGELRGIYLFNVETTEEAEQLTKTDPAVKAGRLVMELHPWYGSAALQQINDLHKKIAKIEI